MSNRLGLFFFELPPERLISISRVVLAAFSLFAIYFDPMQPARFASAAYLLLITYLAFAAGLAAWATQRQLSPRGALLCHTADIAAAFALMLFTDGPISPFFAFFTFILIAATLRWGWRATVRTALLLVVLFATLIAIIALVPALGDAASERGRAIIRLAYFAVAAAMLTYLGAYLDRSRERIARLANWPTQRGNATSLEALEGILSHAATVVRVPRALVVWEQADEGIRHLALYCDGAVTYRRAARHRFGTLVTPDLRNTPFATGDAEQRTVLTADGPQRFAAGVIDSELQTEFGIRSVACAPLGAESCSGHIFLLDRTQWTGDHLVLLRAIGSRLGIDLDHFTLRQRREREAMERERLRLARDIHDGLLQGLTAASLHLNLARREAAPATQAALASVQQTLSAEQRRLREFVEGTRHRGPEAAGRSRNLMTEMEPLVRESGRQWGCDSDLSVTPPGATVNGATARELSFFLSEAIANAAKHGGARSIAVDLSVTANEVLASVRDDGRGIAGLQGDFTQMELGRRRAGPRSLCERAGEIGGELTVSSSPAGACVAIRLPRGEA